MSRKLMKFSIILFGLLLFILTITMLMARDSSELLYAMIVTSNIRDYDQALYLMTPNGNILRRLTTIPGGEFVLAQSPNGKWLLIRSNVNYNTYSVNIGTSAVRELADSNSRYLSVSPDSRWVYFERSVVQPGIYRDVVYRIALNGGQQEDLLTIGNVQYFNYAGLSPDGEWLYIWSDNIHRVHTETHEIQTIQTMDLGYFLGVMNWSPDGEWMYGQFQVADEVRLYRMHPDGSERRQLLPKMSGNVMQLFFAPQDDWLFVLVNSDGMSRLYRMRTDGGELTLIAQNIGIYYGWTSDPEWAFFIGQFEDSPYSLYRLNMTTGERQLTWQDASTSFWWSPNRTQLAFFQNSSLPSPPYFLIDGNGQNLRNIPYESGMTLRAWSPDSQWLYFEKFDNDSSELFRINVQNGKRESVHSPALHNNYQMIFNAWTTIPPSRWYGGWWLVIIGGVVGVWAGIGQHVQHRRKGHN